MADDKSKESIYKNTTDTDAAVDTTFLNQSIEEVKILKRAWYTHFLSVLEKLADNIDSVSDEFHDYKDKIYEEINSLRELLRQEINDAKNSGSIDLEKLESRIEKTIDTLNRLLEKSDHSKDIEEIRKEMAALRLDMSTKIENMMSKHKKEVSDPMKELLTTLKTKIAVWTVVVTMAVSGTISFMFWLLKDYVKKFLVG